VLLEQAFWDDIEIEFGEPPRPICCKHALWDGWLPHPAEFRKVFGLMTHSADATTSTS
jgi:hypothetical protein